MIRLGNGSSDSAASQEAIERQRKVWAEIISKHDNDPYIGYDGLQEATDDCKATSQAEALARMLNHENVFLSGPAGSGKSTVVKKFVEYIEAISDGNVNVAVTASTGIAASMLGPNARTVYSVLGAALMNDEFSKKPEGNRRYRYDKIREIHSLVIDEVSMLSAAVIDHIDALFKHVKRNKEPFGGVQMIFIGDFLQLPPVPTKTPVDGVNYGLAITSKAWGEGGFKHLYMDKVHRAVDPKLREVLNKISRNKLDDKAWNHINERVNADMDSNKTYTNLFTLNRNVDQFNEQKLRENPNPKVSLDTFLLDPNSYRNDGSTIDDLERKRVSKTMQKKVETFMKSNNIPASVDLKEGATVMVTKNISNKLVNGTVGTVRKIYKSTTADDTYVEIRTNNGDYAIVGMATISSEVDTTVMAPNGKEVTIKAPEFSVSYMPLRVAYAITVHKSQGQTLDGVYADLSKCFTPGLGYVALSRVSNMDNLVLSGVNDDTFKMDPVGIKVSKYVKKKAVTARNEFIENKSHYDMVLISKVGIQTAWTEVAF